MKLQLAKNRQVMVDTLRANFRPAREREAGFQ